MFFLSIPMIKTAREFNILYHNLWIKVFIFTNKKIMYQNVYNINKRRQKLKILLNEICMIF